MYDLSNDYLIQKKKQDRQDYFDYQRYAEEAILKWEKAQISLAEKDEMLSEKDEMISTLVAEIEKLRAQIKS